MKKFEWKSVLALALTGALALGLTACGSSDNGAATTGSNDAGSKAVYRTLDEIKESEGLDRMDMKLAQNQLDLLAAVAAVNPNVVVLLSAGSSLETPWLKDCKALVYGCLGGQAGAGALVDVLTGTCLLYTSPSPRD